MRETLHAMGREAWGERVFWLRIERALTLREVQELSGLNTSTLSQIENGRQMPHLSTVRKLARAFDVPVSRITTGAG